MLKGIVLGPLIVFLALILYGAISSVSAHEYCTALILFCIVCLGAFVIKKIVKS